MAGKKKQKHKKKQKRINPLRLLIVLLAEFVVLLGILMFLYEYHPDNPISRTLHEMIDPKPVVVLDAGHGGYDVGSEYQGVFEKDVTLALTKDVGAALEAKGIPVRYTRESDQVEWPADNVKDLNARVKIANTSGAKLFVSLHTNASETGDGSGFEIWGNLQNEQIVAFAKNLHEQISALDYTVDRGIKDVNTAPLHVLYYNKLPCVLIEAGFLESANDRAYLLNDGKRKVFADKIAEGIYQTLQDMEEK